MLNQIDYDLYLKEIAQTNNYFKKIFVGRETFPPVFFYGDTRKVKMMKKQSTLFQKTKFLS